MAAASVVLIWAVLSRRAEPGPSSKPVGIDAIDFVRPVAAVKKGSVIGRADAPVLILEFADFECPYCSQFVRDTFPGLYTGFVESGAVQYAALHLPLTKAHPFAFRAAVAVECAGLQGRYWDMRDRLFRATGGLDATVVVNQTIALNLDRQAFESCKKDNGTVARVHEQRALAREFGINSTPTFLIGRYEADHTVRFLAKIRGAHAYHVFRDAIDRVAAKSAARIR